MQGSVASREIVELKQKYNHLQNRYKEKEVECEDKSIRISMLQACMKKRDSYINEIKKKKKKNDIVDLKNQVSQKDAITSELVKANQLLQDTTSSHERKVESNKKKCQ